MTWIALWIPVIFAAIAIDPVTGSWSYWNYRANHPEIVLMPVMVLLCNAAFALLACFLLRHSLSRRLYSF
jgi:hypothetical protein